MSIRKLICTLFLVSLCGCGDERPDILVMDFGSPATPKIIERLQELKASYVVKAEPLTLKQIKEINPRGVITSGSPASVLDPDSPRPVPELYDLGIPVLGLCYGLQLMAQQLGGQVVHCEKPEEGVILPVTMTGTCDVIPEHMNKVDVWYYHEDCVVSMPEDFEIVGRSENTQLAVACNPKKKLYGVQFHPERFDKTPQAAEIIDQFVRNVVLGQDLVPKGKGIDHMDREFLETQAMIEKLDVSTEVLDLSGRGLKKLPMNIGRLINLKKLVLNKNPLTELPVEIGKLTNLTSLSIYDSQLKALPSEIGKLANLTYLAVYGSQIKTVPAEIGNLVNLRILALDNNQIKSLPPEIGKLVKLDVLFLNFNKLEELPSEMGNLTSLTELKLPHNKLKALPADLTKLANLVLLDASKNQLTSLPTTMGSLTNLRILDVSQNDLKTLPDSMRELKNLKSVNLKGNPDLVDTAVSLKQIEAVKAVAQKVAI